MILLRCPKFPRCLTADAGNFDRGHSLTSLPLPLAALSSLPTSARLTALLATLRRGGVFLPTVVPTDWRPLLWPPIGALPRNRLASSATGSASAISPPAGGAEPLPYAPQRNPPHFLKRCHCETSSQTGRGNPHPSFPQPPCLKGANNEGRGNPPALTHRIIYFVPKIRSPASPRPGTM